MPVDPLSQSELSEQYKTKLEMARHYRHIRMPREAEPILIDLLSETSPEGIKQQALLELATCGDDLLWLTRVA